MREEGDLTEKMEKETDENNALRNSFIICTHYEIITQP